MDKERRKLKSARFVFTKFKPGIEDLDKLKDLSYNYLLIGFEGNLQKNTDHFQGYVELLNPEYLRQMRRLLPNFHLEMAKESREANISYCKKAGNFMSFDLTDRIYSSKEIFSRFLSRCQVVSSDLFFSPFSLPRRERGFGGEG